MTFAFTVYRQTSESHNVEAENIDDAMGAVAGGKSNITASTVISFQLIPIPDAGK